MTDDDLIAELRKTFPLSPKFGPVTARQRKLIHELCDRHEAMRAVLPYMMGQTQ